MGLGLIPSSTGTSYGLGHCHSQLPNHPASGRQNWVARLKLRPRQDGLAPSTSREVLCCIQLGAPKAARGEQGCSLTKPGASGDLHFLSVLEVWVCCVGRNLRAGTGRAWRQGTKAQALLSRGQHPALSLLSELRERLQGSGAKTWIHSTSLTHPASPYVQMDEVPLPWLAHQVEPLEELTLP